MFAVDVAKIVGVTEIAKVIDGMSAFCAHWNSKKMYDNKQCNCQHFVTGMLTYIGLNTEFEKNVQGSVREYMDRLKNDGVCDMRFTIDEGIKDAILTSDSSSELKKMMNSKSIVFTSHQILDEFVSATLEKYPGFPRERPYDYMLLKAFDRAFWLRAQSSKNSEDKTQVSPLTAETGHCLCPFNSTIEVDVNNSIVGTDYDLHDIAIPLPVFKYK